MFFVFKGNVLELYFLYSQDQLFFLYKATYVKFCELYLQIK